MSTKVMDIDGDEFAECDYGLVIDNGQGSQELHQKLDMLAQAALQNQAISFSAIMKLYGSGSLAEKQRIVEKSEQDMKKSQGEAQQQQLQAQQQELAAEKELRVQDIMQKEQANIRDNETKILIATIGAQVADNEDGIQEVDSTKRDELLEKIRQFDKKLELDKEKLLLDKKKHADDVVLKEKVINKKSVTKTT